jgi:hypothetical protein
LSSVALSAFARASPDQSEGGPPNYLNRKGASSLRPVDDRQDFGGVSENAENSFAFDGAPTLLSVHKEGLQARRNYIRHNPGKWGKDKYQK